VARHTPAADPLLVDQARAGDAGDVRPSGSTDPRVRLGADLLPSPIDVALLVLTLAGLAVQVATLPSRVPEFDPTHVASLACLAFAALVWFVLPPTTPTRAGRAIAAVVVGLGATAGLVGASMPTGLGDEPTLLASLGDLSEQLGRAGFQLLLLPCGIPGSLAIVLLGPVIGDAGFAALSLLGLALAAVAILFVARSTALGTGRRVLALGGIVMGIAATASFGTFLLGEAHFGPVASEFVTNWFAGGLFFWNVVAAAGWLLAWRRARRSGAADRG
jgi:hypothetical protein